MMTYPSNIRFYPIDLFLQGKIERFTVFDGEDYEAVTAYLKKKGVKWYDYPDAGDSVIIERSE